MLEEAPLFGTGLGNFSNGVGDLVDRGELEVQRRMLEAGGSWNALAFLGTIGGLPAMLFGAWFGWGLVAQESRRARGAVALALVVFAFGSGSVFSWQIWWFFALASVRSGRFRPSAASSPRSEIDQGSPHRQREPMLPDLR